MECHSQWMLTIRSTASMTTIGQYKVGSKKGEGGESVKNWSFSYKARGQ